jgi:hypothetical protein
LLSQFEDVPNHFRYQGRDQLGCSIADLMTSIIVAKNREDGKRGELLCRIELNAGLIKNHCTQVEARSVAGLLDRLVG